MKARAALLAALLLSGCATMTMSGYVGKPVTDVVMDYGPPANYVDLPDGRRAFQWAFSKTHSTPMTINTTAYSTGPSATAYTTASGGQLITTGCIYTLIARWGPVSNAWIIDDYRTPSIDCM